MYVRRFIRFMTVEVKAIRAYPQDSWHYVPSIKDFQNDVLEIKRPGKSGFEQVKHASSCLTGVRTNLGLQWGRP